MSVVTFEGIVEKGQVLIPPGVVLPEKTKVFVVVPEFDVKKLAAIASPKLVHPDQATDFVKEVIAEPANAGL
ncbi:MAG: hypothetical protein L0Y72_28010 [Gemmataceae bacterium]|nr:hypothetical protein [Gemmataceae bacterium]MCI0742893.1 hypothetical protein [Gemmataceae bacterium]